MSSRCLKGKAKQRTVSRDQYEPLREQLAGRMQTDEAKTTYARRAPIAEGVFASIKASLHFRRFSVRGKANVRSEWFWVCMAYNLRRLIGPMTASLRAHISSCCVLLWPQVVISKACSPLTTLDDTDTNTCFSRLAA